MRDGEARLEYHICKYKYKKYEYENTNKGMRYGEAKWEDHHRHLLDKPMLIPTPILTPIPITQPMMNSKCLAQYVKLFVSILPNIYLAGFLTNLGSSIIYIFRKINTITTFQIWSVGAGCSAGSAMPLDQTVAYTSPIPPPSPFLMLLLLILLLLLQNCQTYEYKSINKSKHLYPFCFHFPTHFSDTLIVVH